MKQFTFWVPSGAKRRSLWAHEHVTLRFTPQGDVQKLSRDGARSVVPTWTTVGWWGNPPSDGVGVVRFSRATRDLAVAATKLQRQGWKVLGCAVFAPETPVRSRATDRVTDPVRLEGGQGRDRTSRLGAPTAGERGSSRFSSGGRFGANVAAMRAAIEARK